MSLGIDPHTRHSTRYVVWCPKPCRGWSGGFSSKSLTNWLAILGCEAIWFNGRVQRTNEATAAKCKAAATMVNRCQTSW